MSQNKNVPAWKRHMSNGGKIQTFARVQEKLPAHSPSKTTGKPANPIYFTHNSVYGNKKGGTIHKPVQKFNRQGDFTKYFCSGAAQNTALNTTTTTSRVHSSLDGGFDS